MLHISESPFEIVLKESCGIAHERQVVEIPAPPGTEHVFALRDAATGEAFPAQRSLSCWTRAFVLLEIRPFQELRLAPINASEDGSPLEGEVRLAVRNGGALLENGLLSVELEADPSKFKAGGLLPGPLRRFKAWQGKWRGAAFLDCAASFEKFAFAVVEEGPVRTCCRFRVDFSGGLFYETLVTLDAGQRFVKFDERFNCGCASQVVWDFKKMDIPERIRLLDSTEGASELLFHCHIDHRMARLAPWTQYTQLFDLSDGFGLVFPEGDEAGFVSLEGGKWEGGRLNHLELWARRWRPNEPSSRRGLPPESKADSFPCPERIPARGQSLCEEHLNLEGWLEKGRRLFALVCLPGSQRSETAPLRPGLPFPKKPATLGHFEATLDRKSLEGRQGFLRRLHIQRGMMPLQSMLGMSFEWTEEEPCGSSFKWPHPSLLSPHGCRSSGGSRKDAESMMAYLAARVCGFWEGSGAAFSNCVVGRRISPEMFRFESLGEGVVAQSERKLCRARFAFLSHLFESDNYYPGIPSMTPPSSPDSLEPTISGMCNQNFYTDIINVFGTAAQVFHLHPAAGIWREKFGKMLRMQLEYHVYTESGAWEESHTYYQHVLATLFPILSRRRADSVDDFFSDKSFQALVSFSLKLATPRDSFSDGFRRIASLGDHHSDSICYRDIYCDYASAFKDSAPALSGHLAWLHMEMGGTRPEAKALRPSPPKWESEQVEGIGMFFRGRDETGREELLILRCGPSWGHHHIDDGSLQFYAKGRTWLADASFGCVAVRPSDKFEAHGHSRWRPKGISPLNYLWKFNRGWTVARGSASGIEWAVAYTPTFMSHPTPKDFLPLPGAIAHFRTIVRLAPCVYLVIDCSCLPEHNVVAYHLPGRAANLSLRGAHATLEADGCAFDVAALPLEGQGALIAESIPADPEMSDRFATTGVEFDCGHGHLAVSAFGIRKKRDLPMSLETDGSTISVKTASSSWNLEFQSQKSFTVSESASGLCVEISIPEFSAGGLR